MSTPIVLLNGSPSAGKTALAEALHRALPVPAFHLSLDEFRTGIRTSSADPTDAVAVFADGADVPEIAGGGRE